jgi:RNA polymerase sigma factor (TIGR02999 family)
MGLGDAMAEPPGDVTRLLKAANAGDRGAVDQILPIVYKELRRIAASYLKHERVDHTLQPTALVHEAYLRLVDQHSMEWQTRAHFIAFAAKQMRRVLVDHARAKTTAKRGGEVVFIQLDDDLGVSWDRDAGLVALDEALDHLAMTDAHLAQVVELRYFGGLTIDEAAAALGISTATVERDWATARAWLRRQLRRGSAP